MFAVGPGQESRSNPKCNYTDCSYLGNRYRCPIGEKIPLQRYNGYPGELLSRVMKEQRSGAWNSSCSLLASSRAFSNDVTVALP